MPKKSKELNLCGFFGDPNIIGENMTSTKQLEVNRENALKSTGPVSLEGKSLASKNTIKHGILSKDLVVSGEKLSEYQAFRHNLIDTFQSEGTMEAY